MALGSGRQLPRWLAAPPVSWLGLGLLAAAFVVIDPASPYPGLWALLPAGGAAALIVGRGRGLGTAQLLGWRPLRFVGRISYSLYLWHWPILTLPALALGEALPIEARLALGALSVVVGAISWRFIEEPFWHGSLSTFRPRPVLATAVATAIAVAVLAVGIGEDSLARVRAAGAEPVAAGRARHASTPPTALGLRAAPDPSASGRQRPVPTADVAEPRRRRRRRRRVAAASASSDPSQSALPPGSPLPIPSDAPVAAPVGAPGRPPAAAGRAPATTRSG